MLTLEEINTRIPTCRSCKARFNVVVPGDSATLSRLQGLWTSNRIEFIRVLREATHCDLGVAKGVMQHATPSGSCHRCERPLPAGRFSDCEGCRSLNIRLDAGD